VQQYTKCNQLFEANACMHHGTWSYYCIPSSAAINMTMFGGLPGLCELKIHSTRRSGSFVGNPAGNVILISTPLWANSRYFRITSLYLKEQSFQPAHEGCIFKLPTRLRGIKHAWQCLLSYAAWFKVRENVQDDAAKQVPPQPKHLLPISGCANVTSDDMMAVANFRIGSTFEYITLLPDWWTGGK